jgi:hypothetical protein
MNLGGLAHPLSTDRYRNQEDLGENSRGQRAIR